MNERPQRVDTTTEAEPQGALPLGTIAREWTRIGVTGFGGPPTHIMLLRRLTVGRGWISEAEFEGAIAACNLLPGPASTQLSIFCARRLGGAAGAWIGGAGFVVPAVVMVSALSALFLARTPPTAVLGAAAGAGAAVAAVAVQAGLSLLGPSYRQAALRGGRVRWRIYAALGAAAAALLVRYLVLVLLACGACELLVRTRLARSLQAHAVALPVMIGAVGGVGALVWVAFKVGALSWGGGFVIIPLMRGDAVGTYHWMSATQFLGAVALGQITPGPVVATVAAVGYAAHGFGGAALAAVVAFAPSFAIVLIGGPHFVRLGDDRRLQAFLGGAGPAAVGAILGSAIPLAGSLREAWQFAVLAAAAVALLALRRGPVLTLLCAGLIGAVVAVAGGPLP